MFFDDVVVPIGRTLEEEGRGWAVAIDILPFERGTALWHRTAYLHTRLDELVAQAPDASLDPSASGEVVQLVHAFRARTRTTQHRLAAGAQLGAETSIDQVMMATAEPAVFDLADTGHAAGIALGDDPASRRWRAECLSSRAATIHGGSGEIPRNIIVRRLLDLGSDR